MTAGQAVFVYLAVIHYEYIDKTYEYIDKVLNQTIDYNNKICNLTHNYYSSHEKLIF
jgi:hypothetical protein